MSRKVFRYEVLLASDVGVTSGLVFVVEVLSLENLLSFVDLCIELNPLLVDRVGDTLAVNAGLNQPRPNSINGLLRWCKQVVDLFCGIPLPVSW